MLESQENWNLLLKHMARLRPQWAVITEDDIVRFVTRQLVLSTKIFRDLEVEFNLEEFDTTFTPNYGIVVSMKRIQK